jgi:hypothetical protein
VNDESTTVLQGFLERAVGGDVTAHSCSRRLRSANFRFLRCDVRFRRRSTATTARKQDKRLQFSLRPALVTP